MVPQFKDPLEPADRLPASAALPAELALWLQRSLGTVAERGVAERGGADAAPATPPAELPWPGNAESARIALRNAVLRALAHRFFTGVPVSIQAGLIGVRAERFEFAQWPRDRKRGHLPAGYRDTPDEFLWAAFKSGAPMPLDKRSLRRILIGVPEFDAAAGDV